MTTQIGDKIILHKNNFPQQDYDEPDEFVCITIVEEKEVPGDYNSEKKHTGYRAKGDDGRIYYCNWDYFPETSSSPMWSWNTPLDDDTYENASRFDFWTDVTQGIFDYIPQRPKFVDKYPDVVHYCDKHKSLTQIYHEDHYDLFERVGFERSKCFECSLRKPPVDMMGKKWNGWF